MHFSKRKTIDLEQILGFGINATKEILYKGPCTFSKKFKKHKHSTANMPKEVEPAEQKHGQDI